MSYSPSYQEGPTQSVVTRPLAVNRGAGQINKYYVRPAGSDSNDGLTELTAFATLAYALTKIPLVYTNEAYFIDITGINETLQQFLPTPIGAPGFIGIEPSSLLFGIIVGQLCIHSDLVVFQSISAVDVLAVNSDIDTNQQTIITSGGLVVNSLVGKQIIQGGDVKGVVKSNTATDILTTSTSLFAATDTDFSDPGATVKDIWIESLTTKIQIEGINIDSDGFNCLLFFNSSGDITVNSCNVGTFSINRNMGMLDLEYCYIIPSTGGNVENLTYSNMFSNSCFFENVIFTSSYNAWGFSSGHTFLNSAFEGCGPIWNSGSGGIRQVSGFGFCFQCEFNNSTDEAIYIYGSGTYNVESTKIDGAGASAIRVAGPAIIDLVAIPVGLGNLGFGCQLESGAQVNALSAVNISGAGGEVKIGTLAPQTWASVTGDPNNRVTDAGVNGDTSSAYRP